MASSGPEKLESMMNIGPSLAQDLRSVGITDGDMLRAIGADEANRRLAEAGRNDGDSAQRSIIGAIAGVKWNAVPRRTGSKPAPSR